jgi:5-methylthioadenosine/S-adenosylhomocysteine deaminase
MIAQHCDLLIVAGCVLTMNREREILADGAISISGNRIMAVGPTRLIEKDWTAPRRIDAHGGIVHPGFIDGHYHAGLHLSRGSIPDEPGGGTGVFARWMNAVTDEDEYASALLAATELARNGFTGFVDAGTTFYPDAVATAAAAVGIRTSLADCLLWDIVGGEPLAAEIQRAPCDGTRARRELGGQLKRNRDPDALVRGHVALYGSGSASEELMRAATTLAESEGVVYHQHQSLTRAEADYDRQRFSKPAMVHFAERGLLGKNSVFTHMNILDEAEVEAVSASGMTVVWHPGNFMYYAISQTGRSTFPALHRRGTAVAFGTDIAKAWAFGDLGLIAYLVSKEWGEYLRSDQILEMFTLGGARAIGLARDLGSLEAGKRADLVIRTAEPPDTQPNVDIVRQLALISRSKAVDTVICNGDIIVRHGRLTRLDETEIYRIAHRSATETAARAGLKPPGRWPVVT